MCLHAFCADPGRARSQVLILQLKRGFDVTLVYVDIVPSRDGEDVGLMSPLNGTVSFEEVNAVSFFVTENLNFDMSGFF